MGGKRVPLREVHAAYAVARGRVMSTSTLRLRWKARPLPRHSADPLVMATAKAVRDELRDRGEATT